MAGKTPRDFPEWMRKVDRQLEAASRNSARAVQGVREVKDEVGEVVLPGIPAAPVEITTQSAIYKSESGAWRGRIDVEFPDVVFTVDQKPIKVAGYEMYGYEEALFPEGTPIVWQQYGGSDISSITRMDLPTNRWYIMKVRAINGEWSTPFRVQTAKDTTPPPQPTAPTAKVFLGSITVKWDGKAVTGDMPADTEAVILCVGTDPSPGLTKEVTRFAPDDRIFVLTELAYYKPVFIRLIAVDHSGNYSPWSEQVTAFIKPLVDADIILGEIDAGKTIIKNAEKVVLSTGAELGANLSATATTLAATEKRLTGPGGLTERLGGAERLLADAGSLTYAAGQTLRQKLAASDSLISSATGQISTLQNTTIPNLNSALSGATGRLTTAEGKITAAEGKITTAVADLDLAEKAITDNKLVMDGAVTRLGAAEGEITSAKGRLTAAEGKVTTLQNTTIPNLNSALSGATGRLTTAEGKITAAEGTLSTAVADLDLAEKAISDNKLVMDGAITRLGSAEGLLTDARTRLGAAEGKVATLQNTTLPGLTSEISAATGRLTTAEGKITKAEGTLSTATSDLTKLTNRVSPLESGINTLNNTTIPGLQLSIDGKTAILRKTVAPTAADIADPGTRWEVWTTLNAGGKLTGTWRRTATTNAWIEDVLSASYLPLVDIGAGTFGSLNGGRITAKSIATDTLLVGDFTNLIDDPNCEGPGWEIPTAYASMVQRSATLSYDGQTVGGWILSPTTIGLRVNNRNWFTVEPDTELYLEATVSNRTNAPLYYRIEWRSSTGTSTTPSYSDVTFVGRPAGDTGWSTISRSVTPPPGARQARMILIQGTSATSGSAYVILPSARRKNAGNLIVSGTITGDHVAAESVAAKIGSFLSLTTDQLVAGSAVLGDAVAQKIAAATASFQKVDAKNLTVTGTSSLSTVVAQRLAAETGVFMSLTTDQLEAGTAVLGTAVAQKIAAATATFQKADISNLTAGTANMTQAVIDKLVANTASFQKVTVDNITATATANLNSVVAQRIAAGTASFQTVDVKNLFVTGTASMNEVVAKRIAAETGVFISLTTDQLVAGTANINSLVAQKIAAGTAAFQKADISNLTAGTANMTQAVIDKLVANTAAFQTVTVGNITATATANLNSVVAQRIAAGTASFQTVDVKNLFVTGTASMDDVVAKRIASETGAFIKLSVDQLTVVGTANMATAVADRMFANIFASNKLTTNELLVGKGENLIPWMVNNPESSRTVAPHVAVNGATALSIDATPTGGLIGAHALTNNQNVTPGTYATTVSLRPGTKAPNLPTGVFEVLPNTKYKVSVWVRAGGSYTTYPSIRLNIGIFNGEGTYTNGPWYSEAKVISWSWQEIAYEFTTAATSSGASINVQMNQPGVLRIDQPMFVRDGASLIATGGIVADHITASEEMSAKVGTFLKLNVNQLVATGTSSLNTAVIESLWTNVVRSRSITTDMLTVGSGPNAIVDPFFESPEIKVIRKSRTAGWGGWSRNSTLNLNWYGASGLAGTSNSFYFDSASTSEPGTMIAVEEGQKWRFKAKYNATTNGPRATARIIYKDGSTAYSASWWTTDTGGSNGYGPTGVQDFDRIFTVPENVAYITPALQFPTDTTAAYVYGGASLVNMATSAVIVDGAITTKKLTITEEMTAALLKAKKVEAIEIDANSLRADVGFIGILRAGILVTDVVTSTHIKSDSITTDLLKSDAITAKHVLTGPLIRSAASGARTEMTNQGIRVLNASNVELVRLGYGISTGMSVRNPVSGTLVPLANMVFGTQVIQGYANANYVTNKITPAKGTMTFEVIAEGNVPTTPTRVWMTAQTDTHVVNFQMAMGAWTNSSFVKPETLEGRAGMCTIGVQIFPESGTIPSNYLGNISGTVGYNLTYDSYLSGMFMATGLVPGRRYRFVVLITNLDTDSPLISSTYTPDKITILSLPM